MQNSRKHVIAALILASLIGVVVLSSGLSGLQLKPGEPFPSGALPAHTDGRGIPPPGNLGSLSIFRGVLAVVLVVLMIYVPARLISLIDLRKLVAPVAILVMLLLLALTVPDIPVGQAVYRPQGTGGGASASSGQEYAPLSRVPLPLFWLVGVALLAGAGALIVQVYRARLLQSSLADQLGEQAKQALDSLEIGADPRDVILYCYVQMSRCIENVYGLRREEHLTVREYRDRLERHGLPAMPLMNLSALFEKVRYGRRPIDPLEERQAEASLQQIISFCRGTGPEA